MRRTLPAVATIALAAALAGCATAPVTELSQDGVAHGVALQEDGSGGARAKSGPGVGDYALVLPKNIAWVPWKIVGGTVKGLGDGVAAGFDAGREPILGLLFSPVNAVVGLVTGFGTGFVSQPFFMGPRDDFGNTMSLPTSRPTPIWWLPE